jgi:hypothetical protein
MGITFTFMRDDTFAAGLAPIMFGTPGGNIDYVSGGSARTRGAFA